MSLLDPEHTVQASPAMAAAVASVRRWVGGQPSACVVVAAAGSGKSHLLTAARNELEGPLVMPPADGSDCAEFLALLKSGRGFAVVADDLDKFSKGLREEVIKRVAAGGHSLLASMTELSGRSKGLIEAKCPDAKFVHVGAPASRPEDVQAFVELWLQINGLASDPIGTGECAQFCCASDLPHGLQTVDSFLRALAQSDWAFSGHLPAADAASAFRVATSPPPKRPTLLVEGYTDRMYLEWQLRGLAGPPDVEIRDCGGATIVAEQTIALRNQGRRCVAVLDSDPIGKQLRTDLRRYGHPVASVPVECTNLPKSALDHVQQVAEIEDLLPAEMVQTFLAGHGRQPELEIRWSAGVRYVIGEGDKRDLAVWVVEEHDYDAAPKLAAFLKQALEMLNAA